jgi:hypothetical protein
LPGAPSLRSLQRWDSTGVDPLGFDFFRIRD